MTTRPREHGYARYKLDGCRCNKCGWAVAQYNDAREHAIRRGTWQPFVDAAPVREHLLRLQTCDMGLRPIAAAAGVERKTLSSILRGRPARGTGPQERVRPALAAAILGVEPTLDTLGASTPIDATGTRRRLTALVAGGWPQAHLAPRLGLTPNNFTTLLSRDRVLVRTARASRLLYDELWRADPREHGVGAQGYSRARNHAVANLWAPVGAWDDDTIDDPAAFPDWTGYCGTAQGAGAHRRQRLPVCGPCRGAATAARKAREAGVAA